MALISMLRITLVSTCCTWPPRVTSLSQSTSLSCEGSIWEVETIEVAHPCTGQPTRRLRSPWCIFWVGSMNWMIKIVMGLRLCIWQSKVSKVLRAQDQSGRYWSEVPHVMPQIIRIVSLSISQSSWPLHTWGQPYSRIWLRLKIWIAWCWKRHSSSLRNLWTHLSLCGHSCVLYIW